MEKVFNTSGSISWINEVMVVESNPPLKYAPTGTSARNLILTASFNNSLNSATVSDTLRVAVSFEKEKSASQYFSILIPELFTCMKCPGGNWYIFSKGVFGAIVVQNVKIWARLSVFNAFFTVSIAKSPFISEQNANTL